MILVDFEPGFGIIPWEMAAKDDVDDEILRLLMEPFPPLSGTQQRQETDQLEEDEVKNDVSELHSNRTRPYLSESVSKKRLREGNDGRPMQLKSQKSSVELNALLHDPNLYRGVFTTGPWQPHEEKMLLHIMYCFTTSDLRIMASIAWRCGVARPRRAIEKKIKRILNLRTWKDSDAELIRQGITNLFIECADVGLSSEGSEKLQQLRNDFKRAGIYSYEPWIDPENLQGTIKGSSMFQF